MGKMLRWKVLGAWCTLRELEESGESIVFTEGPFTEAPIFREVHKRQSASSTGTFDLKGSSSHVGMRQSEHLTDVPNSSSNVRERVPETGFEDSDTEDVCSFCTVSQKLTETEHVMACTDRGELTKAELGFQQLLDSNSDPVEEIMLKFELGRVKQKMNKLQEAETIFLEALATAEARGCEKECAAILHELGVVQREKKEWSEAEKYLRKSLEMRMVANAETHQIVKTVVELGRVLHETHGGDAALHFVQEVLGNCRMKVLPARLLSWTHHEIGRWCYSKGDINSAQSHFVEALSHDYSVCDGTFSDSDRDLSFAYTLHEMGLVAKSSRKVAAAMVCFTEALHRKIRAKCPDEQVKLTEEELGTLCMSEPSQPALHLTAREDAVQNSPPRQSLIKPKILYNVRPS